MNFLKQHWLLIAILVIALAFRLYRIDATMTFLEDEGRDLLIAKRMIDTGRPVLLGPQTSTGNMYLGPLYYYLITPALFLAGMNPVGPAILIAISGVLTAYLLYYLGKKWFGTTAGYLGATLFAVLPFSVMVTRASWNPNLVPFIATCMLVAYDRLVYGRAKLVDWLFYGLLIGVMVQLHYMALVFCGVLSLSIVWNKRQELMQVVRGVPLAFVGFILMLLPFIVFEIRNNWVNTRAITRFMEAKEERNIRYDLPVWLWWDKVGRSSYRLIGNTLIGSEMGMQPAAPYVVSGFLTLVLINFILALKQGNKQYLHLILIFLGCMAILGIYQENIHMHYLEFGLPLIILLLSGIFKPKSPKFLLAINCLFVLVVLGIGGARSLSYVTSGATHQAEKAQLVTAYIAQKSEGTSYNIISSPQTSTSPYQYFAFINPHPPSNLAQSHVFMICQNKECIPEDLQNPLMFVHGPSHPTLDNYVGHPLATYVVERKNVISNEHVAYGIWVAEIVLE